MTATLPVRDAAHHAHPTPLNARVLRWAVTSALAGFLFGFDTVVVSGAEQAIQRLWSLTALEHGVLLGAALYGTVIGSIGGGWLADRFGRTPVLLGVGVLYILSAIGCAWAPNAPVFLVARVLGGLGIGVSTVVAPLYITEIAPAAWRGRLTAMFQFNIVFGIVVAFGSNALLADVGANAWRWMLGVAVVPSVLYAVLCIGLPESPRWLTGRRQDRAATLRVLARIEPTHTAEQIAAEADRLGQLTATGPRSRRPFWTRALRTPILFAILVAAFNQLSGINAILYFAPRIFELAGLAQHAALLTSVGIGITNLIFTFVGLGLIDRLGRRTLLIIGSFGYLASLGTCAWAFATGHQSVVPAAIFAFIAAHAIGSGTVIWVFIAEIFPDAQRAAGGALGSATHWVFAALLTTLFPILVAHVAAWMIFAGFAIMMAAQLVWALAAMPETKGIPLEAMGTRLAQ
jgi:MFS transporter, SP family, arabinose:H+ symporter